MSKETLIALKRDLVNQVKNQIENKRLQLRQGMQELEEAMEEDTNNSSADQFEAGRAMYQIDRDRLGRQLQETLQQQRMFHQNDNGPDAQAKPRIRPGHLLQTNTGYFFLTIPLGIVKVEDKQVFVISAVSPLGQEFLDKTIGDTVSFNGQQHKILEIC